MGFDNIGTGIKYQYQKYFVPEKVSVSFKILSTVTHWYISRNPLSKTLRMVRIIYSKMGANCHVVGRRSTLAHPVEGHLDQMGMMMMVMMRLVALVPMICQQGRIGGTSSIATPTIHKKYTHDTQYAHNTHALWTRNTLHYFCCTAVPKTTLVALL